MQVELDADQNDVGVTEVNGYLFARIPRPDGSHVVLTDRPEVPRQRVRGEAS